MTKVKKCLELNGFQASKTQKKFFDFEYFFSDGGLF